MAEAGLLLAFDFGLRHIGWATGQHLTASATAGSALAAQEGTPNWQAVHALLEEWQPVRIIVGLPLNMDDTENDMCPGPTLRPAPRRALWHSRNVPGRAPLQSGSRRALPRPRPKQSPRRSGPNHS